MQSFSAIFLPAVAEAKQAEALRLCQSTPPLASVDANGLWIHIFPALELPVQNRSPEVESQDQRSYGDLADCTWQVTEKLGCFWPNAEVDRFFLAVHGHYFRSCPVSGRAMRDPPSSILYPFVVVPIVVTLLVTALVVWQSKHTEGIV
ncbi:receptor activity-modifying protein 1 isoform X2 [Aotus nancymaae]|uniref:receptor activity-modifying protein 1 isoform X2 n=1 Tax=Aotus nancymaae TaxID=37293 RepID=UPI0030FEB068